MFNAEVLLEDNELFSQVFNDSFHLEKYCQTKTLVTPTTAESSTTA
jgi:hypothetical protein